VRGRDQGRRVAILIAHHARPAQEVHHVDARRGSGARGDLLRTLAEGP
jgi:hypothetical protein